MPSLNDQPLAPQSTGSNLGGARSGDAAFDALVARLAEMSRSLETQPDWLAEQFTLLARAGVLGWVIPAEWGGSELGQQELIAGYVRLAEACLTTAFILTQFNGACVRIAASDNVQLKSELLPQLARGQLFATVGISHLTTSRQHLDRPAVEAVEMEGGYRLRGEVPWVTGASHADFIVTGGTLLDGRQLLALVPARTRGVVVQPAGKLLALTASQTASVVLEGAVVDRRFILAGPVERVMQSGVGAGTGSLVTSALALGHSKGAVLRLAVEVAQRADLAEILQPLSDECTRLERDIQQAVVCQTQPSQSSLPKSPPDSLLPAVGESPLSPNSLRTRANSLVLRSTQALLAASKGAGFVTGHPAERAVREALFFLVWSCPQPVLAAALRELSCLSPAP